MIQIAYAPSFKRAYKKRIAYEENLRNKYEEKLVAFLNNPNDSTLKLHNLSGKLKGMSSFRVDFDNRVVLYFEDETHAVFVDIGPHDEVY